MIDHLWLTKSRQHAFSEQTDPFRIGESVRSPEFEPAVPGVEASIEATYLRLIRVSARGQPGAGPPARAADLINAAAAGAPVTAELRLMVAQLATVAGVVADAARADL